MDLLQELEALEKSLKREQRTLRKQGDNSVLLPTDEEWNFLLNIASPFDSVYPDVKSAQLIKLLHDEYRAGIALDTYGKQDGFTSRYLYLHISRRTARFRPQQEQLIDAYIEARKRLGSFKAEVHVVSSPEGVVTGYPRFHHHTADVVEYPTVFYTNYLDGGRPFASLSEGLSYIYTLDNWQKK